MLFVSGELDESPPPAHPFPPQHTWGWTQHNPFVANYETKRRSVYLMQQRLRRNPYLALFDGPDPSSSTGVRLLSTTPLQALFMMNDPLAHASAEKLAARALASGPDETARLDFAWPTAWSQPPEPEGRADDSRTLEAYATGVAQLSSVR